jgi:hypothetical protein
MTFIGIHSAIGATLASCILASALLAQPGLAGDLVISTAPLHGNTASCRDDNAHVSEQVEALLQQNAQLAEQVRELSRQLHEARNGRYIPSASPPNTGPPSHSTRSPIRPTHPVQMPAP